ncbi:MAG: dockerin type I domain-containing protein, partial [Planctomycetota bacterium]|nr:dockerin type I domain-containing protein [Planctomycetota bacterium]
QQAATAASRGLLLERLCPIDLAARLRFHMLMGSFDEGDGTISPRVRIGEAPWTVLASADPVNSVTGSLGDLSMFQIDLPATVERSYPIQFLIDDQNATVQGPLFVLYLRAENRDRQSGVSFHTLLHRGGKGLRTFAEDLILASDDYLSQFFAQVRWLQGEQKHVLVRINSGLNDRNDSTPSVGPNAGYASNTRQGYADNLQAIINRIREVWALNEWPEEELFFLLTPSHAIYLPDDPMLINYRDAAAAVAAENDRTGFVNLNVLADATVMSVNGWWDITGRVHLKQSGYEGLSELEIDALQQVIFRPRRSPDLDGDGAVNAGDLATLLSSWGACEPIPAECVADLDGDGAVNAGDLATLLSRWGTLPEFDS